MIRHRHPAAALLAALTLLAGLGASAPAGAQTTYNHFPGTAATDDGRFVALAGDRIETLAQDSLTFILAVPPGETQFELGIFDGDTGAVSATGHHWDLRGTQLQYALFYDPYQLGSTDPANLVGVWRGNEINPTTDPAGRWSADSASFPDNGWWNLTVNVPEPPDPLPGQAPSGATFFHLCISYRGTTAAGAQDPCTGDVRGPDPQPQTLSNFKIRATTNISVLSFAFAYEGAMRFTNRDPFVLYPTWDGTFPGLGDTGWLTFPTTYDGSWSFLLDVPVSLDRLRVFDGDFDFGTAAATTASPSGATMVPCADTDDLDTPNESDSPAFVLGTAGQRKDDSLPEGARVGGGVPADDNRGDAFRRSPCVQYRVTSPGPDGDLATAADNVVFHNDNPSSQREWEQFLVSSDPGCDSSSLCDPALGVCADHCTAGALPPGTWRIDVEGVDLSNLNAWHSDQVSGFCLGCDTLPRPYAVGDTVFWDLDGDGAQNGDEPGISGVVLELLDPHGAILGQRVTGDGSGYLPGRWQACRAMNTGAGLVVDEFGLYCFEVSVPNSDPAGLDSMGYTVRVADSNFQPGGALYDLFGVVPSASLPSPEQDDTVVEEGDNVLTYDFGYLDDRPCGDCEGKITRLVFRYLGTSTVQVDMWARRAGSNDPVFSGVVSPGELVTVVGPASANAGFDGTLGTELFIEVDGAFHAQVHTSCSQEIGAGTVVGDFVVMQAVSREGGPLCPVGDETSALEGDGGDDGSNGQGRGRGRGK